MNTLAEDAGAAGNGQRRRVLLIITLVMLALAVALLLWWKLVLSVRETTNDAYIAGHELIISSQVPGTIVTVGADNTDLVKAGDMLVRLDPVDADTAMQRARSALAAAVRAARTETANAAQGNALVLTRRTELANAEAILARREPLAADAAVSKEEIDDARSAVERARAALRQAEAQSQAAHAAVDGVSVAETPGVLQARAAFREAWVKAQRTGILAPISGRVAQRAAQIGQRVQPGQALMTLVPEVDFWVDANFRETQLQHLVIGQSARVVVDMYGSGVVFHGHVLGMSAGTGGAFALLPPQNASGNWIKVIQRVPVRIAIDPADQRAYPLHIGLSSEVDVDSTSKPQAVPARAPEPGLATLNMAKFEVEADAVVAANLRGLR